MHDISEIETIVKGHFERLDRWRGVYSMMQQAADHDLWTSDKGGSVMATWFGTASADIPVRRQVNTIKPFLNRTKALLYARAPRITVSPCKVQPTTSRQTYSADMGDALSEVSTEMVRAPSFRRMAENALTQALLMPGCALKFGYDGTANTALDRVWCEVIPRWYAGWDEFAWTADQQKYRFHIRWELMSKAKTLCPELDEHCSMPLGDWIVDGATPSKSTTDKSRAGGYVQLLEWWDLEAEEVQVFHLDGMTVKECGSKPEKIAYRWPNGKPVVQIVPVILDSTVAMPQRPVSLARAVFEETMEKSLILSLLVSAFRRDAARVILFFEKWGIPEGRLKQIMNARDTELVGIPTPKDGALPPDLASIFHVLDLGELGGTWSKAQQLVSMAASDSSTTSGLAQGKVGGLEYAPATTTQTLASGDAAVMSLPAERMMEYLIEVVRGSFVMFAKHGVGLKVDMGERTVTVTPAHLRLPWVVKGEDVATEAAKRNAFKTEVVQMLPMLQQAVAQSAVAADQNGTEVPPIIRSSAERTVDLLVDTFGLPEKFRFSQLAKAKPRIEAPEPPEPDEDEAQPEQPEAAGGVPEQPEQPEMTPDDERIAQWLARLSPEQLAAVQQASAGVPGTEPGVQ